MRHKILAIAMAVVITLVLAIPAMADSPVNPQGAEPVVPGEEEHGMGAILEPEEVIAAMPQVPADAARPLGVEQVAAAVDHSAGLPPVGDQGPKGTCVAWATTYYYRTYQEGVEHGWDLALLDGGPNPDTVFSPAWTFSIGGNLDDDCSGMMTSAAFTIFDEQGATTLAVMPNVYSPWYQPTELQVGAAFPYRAVGPFNLGTGLNTPRNWLNGAFSAAGYTPPEGDIFNISINVPSVGFGDADLLGACPNRWIDPAVLETATAAGGHAVTIVGYNDEITFTGGLSATAVYTGAFRLVNSWGVDWGCNGQVWVPYDAWLASLGDGNPFLNATYGAINLTNYAIHGRVTTGGSTGLAGVEVRLNNNPYLATTTDASGYYTLTPGYNGGYTLTVKPLMEGYTFAPPIFASTITTTTTGVDFVATAGAADLGDSTKTVDHAVVPAGTPVEFTVDVDNAGAGASFVLTDVIPAGSTYVPNSAEAEWGTVYAEGDLAPWEALAVTLNTPRYGLAAEIGEDSGGNAYVYAIGGQDTETGQTLDSVERAMINPDGSLGAWEELTETLNAPRAFLDTVMVNVGGTDYIYAGGGGQGYTATAVSVPGLHTDLGTVELAPVNADGTVGPWETLTATLNITRSEASIVSDGNYLWVLGGVNWNPDLYPLRAGIHPLLSVEAAEIRADGTLGAFTPTTALRDTRSTADAIIVADGTNSYIELIGGRTGGNVDRAYGERAMINADGTLGAWAISERLHWGRYGLAVEYLNNYLYAIGGEDHGGPLAEVDRTWVNTDSTLDGWNLTPGEMVTPRSSFAAVTYDGRIYAIGGRVTELYCVDYYDRGSGCGESIDSVEMVEPVEPGTIWWSGEIGEADALAITFSVWPEADFTNEAEINDGTATTVVTESVHVMAVDMSGAMKEVYPDTVSIGDTLLFTITVPNAGGWTEADVMDMLPDGLEYVLGSGQASAGVMGEPGEVWEWIEADDGPTWQRFYFQLVAPGNGYVYAIGPWDAAEYAPINPDGSLGDWEFTTAMSTDRQGVAAVAPGNGYIYAVGGGPNGTDGLDTVERAPINVDGTLGAWEVLTSTLVYPRAWHNVVAYDGYLYALSGYEGHQYTSYTSTEYCEIYANGTLGPWQELDATVNHTRDMAGAVAYNGYVYIAGGEDWNIGSDDTIEYAQINPDHTLGNFVVSPNAMNNVRDTFGFVEVDGILYAIGGRQWGTHDGPDQDTVESAEILADGSVSPWMMNHGELPTGLGFASAAAADGFIYVANQWSSYYAEILDSVVWSGDVGYNDEATLTFEAMLVGPVQSEDIINTAEIMYGMDTLERSASFALDRDWTKEIWISGEGPFGPDDSPFASLVSSDTVTIVDMVTITETNGIDFSLVEMWSDPLNLVTHTVYALPGGTTIFPGSAVLPGTGALTWTVSNSQVGWTYVISKTFEVTADQQEDTAYIAESLSYEDVVQPTEVMLEFQPGVYGIYLPLVMRNY
jgi:cathepsin K